MPDVKQQAGHAPIFGLSEAELIGEIDAGLADIRAGRVIASDVVLAQIQSKIDDYLKKTLVEDGGSVGTSGETS